MAGCTVKCAMAVLAVTYLSCATFCASAKQPKLLWGGSVGRLLTDRRDYANFFKLHGCSNYRFQQFQTPVFTRSSCLRFARMRTLSVPASNQPALHRVANSLLAAAIGPQQNLVPELDHLHREDERQPLQHIMRYGWPESQEEEEQQQQKQYSMIIQHQMPVRQLQQVCSPSTRLCGGICVSLTNSSACGPSCIRCPRPVSNGASSCSARGQCGVSCRPGFERVPGRTACRVCGRDTYKSAWGPGPCIKCPGSSQTLGTSAEDHDAATDCIPGEAHQRIPEDFLQVHHCIIVLLWGWGLGFCSKEAGLPQQWFHLWRP